MAVRTVKSRTERTVMQFQRIKGQITHKTDERKTCEALAAPLFDGRIFAGSSSGVVYCFDALTGQQLWSAAVEGAVRNRPAADHERVYVTDEASKLYAFDKNSGKLIWTAPVSTEQSRVYGRDGADDVPQPVVTGNRVLVFAGEREETVLLAFAAETGKLLLETAVPPKEAHYIRGYRLPAL
ncbi:PQQ-binding-like beta-propeller repeat protein [Phosphitispora fastidiosa]|uniref:outer membrane protein assembly factor BamB family protein n=1 Tax=Phosphitispora fastidiosa TaxID=2837202 RepID=UPI001E365755|nr:PQQ-binding-like beta-propeller repeat protein [Phosphitispora fastidiosa]MBU7006141.1 outer membrane protein assembly factor BamB [Phosphitispora fastidiosa]